MNNIRQFLSWELIYLHGFPMMLSFNRSIISFDYLFRTCSNAILFFFSRRANRIQPVNTACRIRSERPCPPNKYRTPSGACNNVRHPAWGARGSPFLKLLPSAYSNGKENTCYIFMRAFCLK